MAILTSITQRLYHYCSYGIITNLFTHQLFTDIQSFTYQFIIIIISLFTIYYLYTQQKLESEREEQIPQMKKLDLVYENLTWLNQIIRWFSLTHINTRPLAVQRWLDDINITLDKQQTEISTYIYGFREGTVAPWIRKIENVKTDEDGTLRMTATFETGSEFGFLIDVEERVENKLQQSTYSLILTKFICKFDICMIRHDNGDVEIEMKANNRKPSVSMKMKPHVQQRQIQSTLPEVISNAVIDAVIATPIIYIIDYTNPPPPSTTTNGGGNIADFYDVKEDEDDDGGSNTEASSEDEQEREVETTTNQQAANDVTIGGGDVILATNDVTIADDLLVVEVISIDPPTSSSTRFSLQLDSPLQRKNLCNVGEIYKLQRNSMTSQLKVGVVFHSTPSDAHKSNGVEQTLSLDEVDLDLRNLSTQYQSITLEGKDDHGSPMSACIQLKISTTSSQAAGNKSQNMKSSSTSLMSNHGISPMTKVTSSSHTSSPTYRPTSVGSDMTSHESSEDVRYVNKSIADSVLTDLHEETTTKNQIKSRIIVCASQQQQEETKQEEIEDSAGDASRLSVPNCTNPDISQQLQEIRRTQSLRMEGRFDDVMTTIHDDEIMTSCSEADPGSPRAFAVDKKKKKISTIKRVFSMGKKKKKDQQQSEDGGGSQLLSPSKSMSSPTKSMSGSIKRKNRASSFRNLLHLGKKK